MTESNPAQVILTDDGIKIIKAQDTADNAQSAANNAASGITNLNDPNYLSPFEKPQLQVQMDNFATIYAADKDIAVSEGIDFAAYDAAYQAYLTYMTPLVADMTTYSPIVRSTFNGMVTAVQAEQKRFSAATQAQYNQQIKQAQTDIDDGQTKYKALQNSLVKKGDVVNQFNIDAGGALLSTSGNSTKIVFSAPNIIFDSNNPVQIPNVNIPGTLTGKTIEAGKITATTKLFGSDIEAPLIHSPSGSFKLDGNTGDIIGASIHSADNSWGIDKDGNISGVDIKIGGTYSYVGTGSGQVHTGAIHNELNSAGYHQWTDENDHVRINDGVITITNDADEKANANIEGIPLGVFISEGDTQLTGNLKIGNIYTDGAHTINSVNGDDLWLEKGEGSGNDLVNFHAGVVFTGGLHTNNLGLNSAHTLSSADGGGIYVKDTYNGGGNMVDLHVKKLYESSLLSLKTDIKLIDPNTALETINNTDFMSYHFKNDKSNEPISVSPILDDINPIPKYNTPDIFKSADGASRNDGNILGYTALAVKALYAKIQDLQNRLQKLEGAQ